MQKLINKLNELKEKYPIHEHFDWGFPSNTPIDISQNIKSNYVKNIYLKENFTIALENDINLKNHYWIIQEWGGIKSLKQNNKNDEKIIKFKKQLEKNELTKETFGLISSFSKIASFMKPDKYAIYDSRAIYSLNWLLLNYINETELYPQPSGRNPKLSMYDMQTIIRLTNKGHSYKSHKIAYHDYCNLLIDLSKKIYNDNRPYQIEMLLFILAPIEIIENIKSTVEIKIHPCE
ncbi:MAG: hypothetical protein Q7S59_04580 [Sulfurimonas sp.]|nr:hypothetical protein [Sulfurimonas sp.]